MQTPDDKAPEKEGQQDDLVFTPGGPRRRSAVHLARGNQAIDSEFVTVPGGRRHRQSVRRVESGHRFSFGEGAATRLRPKASPGPPDSANWITCGSWTDASSQNAVTSLVSNWVVPPEPTNKASQLLYLFNGLEPANGQLILQPVLQWGDSGIGNDGQGSFWTIASWLVGGADDSATHTPHIRVSPGEVLVGAMKLLSRSSEGSIYSCEFLNRPGTQLITPAIPELIWCYETLEAYELQGAHTPPYDLDQPTEYPPNASIAFGAIDIVTSDVNPSGSWQVSDFVKDYGEHTAIVSNTSTRGEVDIYFRAATTE
jgi:hypothetical protein